MQCVTCEWLIPITDSAGNDIYLCVNTESGAYLSEAGICGNCNADGEYD